MAKLIPMAERMTRARECIQKAREYPVPEDTGKGDFSYVAQVKDLLRQARDYIKFISYTPSATAEIKKEVQAIYAEVDQAEKDLLHK